MRLIAIDDYPLVSQLIPIKEELFFELAGVLMSNTGDEHEYDLLEVMSMYENGEVDGILVSYVYAFKKGNTVQFLLDHNLKREDVWVVTPESFDEGNFNNLVRLTDFSVLDCIEYHIIDRCNLNCKGCTHYAPLITEENKKIPEQVRDEFLALRSKVQYISRITLLGGEPLLNENLVDIIYEVKKIFPYTRVDIITNGTLVLDMSKLLIDTLVKFGIQLNISYYPVLLPDVRKIHDFLRSNGVQYSLNGPILDFDYVWSTESKNLNAVSPNCYIVNYYNYKLYSCPTKAYGFRFAEKYGFNWTDYGLDTRQDLDNEALQRLYQFEECCTHCICQTDENRVKRSHKWEVTDDPQASDWVYNRG